MDRRQADGGRSGLRWFAPLFGTWAFALLVLWLVVGQDGIPYEDLLLDPAQYGNRPWYTGLVSNLGVLGWTAAVVSSGLGASAAARGGRHRAADMLRAGALLSGLLLLDDLFQLHIVVPRALATSKLAFYGLYAVLSSWWVTTNRSELHRTRWPLLAAAGAAFGGSIAVDLVGDGRELALVVEDSAKFLGITAWALYFILTTADIAGSLAAASTWPTGNAQPTPMGAVGGSSQLALISRPAGGTPATGGPDSPGSTR